MVQVLIIQLMVNISGFTPGATLQNSNDIDKVCFEIENSYLDLEMMLTCPRTKHKYVQFL